MEKQKIGKGLVGGGIVGVIMFLIAEIYLYSNRLREVETESFTVLGSGQIHTITVGIENWLEIFIICLFMQAICLFVVSAGFRMMKSEEL